MSYILRIWGTTIFEKAFVPRSRKTVLKKRHIQRDRTDYKAKFNQQKNF